jgi:hypothetical protein
MVLAPQCPLKALPESFILKETPKPFSPSNHRIPCKERTLGAKHQCLLKHPLINMFPKQLRLMLGVITPVQPVENPISLSSCLSALIQLFIRTAAFTGNRQGKAGNLLRHRPVAALTLMTPLLIIIPSKMFFVITCMLNIRVDNHTPA